MCIYSDVLIENIWFTQKKLNRYHIIPQIIESINNKEYIDRVLLQQDDQNELMVVNGHHRITAYWLSGRRILTRDEFVLIYGCSKNRFFKVNELNKIVS